MPSQTDETFDPLRYLALARTLAEIEDDCNLRTVVSRAYYAIFLVVQDRLSVVTQYDVHSEVLARLQRRHKYAAKSLLSEMRRLRQVADYEMAPSDVAYSDWRKNWDRQDLLASSLLLQIQDL